MFEFPEYSGNLPEHCNVNWEDRDPQLVVDGKITGVYYVDHERNPYSEPSSPTTSSVICYQVTTEARRPYGQTVLEFVTVSGQLTGIEAWDQVDVLPLGLGVKVQFTEGDEQRPVIASTEWDFNSKLLHNKADGPKTVTVRRGARDEIDKDGQRSLASASGQQLNLGAMSGDGDLKRLMKEDMVGALVLAMSQAATVSADPGVQAFVADLAIRLNTAWITSNSTTAIKGK